MNPSKCPGGVKHGCVVLGTLPNLGVLETLVTLGFLGTQGAQGTLEAIGSQAALGTLVNTQDAGSMMVWS